MLQGNTGRGRGGAHGVAGGECVLETLELGAVELELLAWAREKDVVAPVNTKIYRKITRVHEKITRVIRKPDTGTVSGHGDTACARGENNAHEGYAHEDRHRMRTRARGPPVCFAEPPALAKLPLNVAASKGGLVF